MDYRKFLPEPPDECRDPELFRLLNEFHFVRWHPDHEARRDEIRMELTSESVLSRAETALDDPYDLDSLREQAKVFLQHCHELKQGK